MTVYDKATEERINALNLELEPFYLVDHHNGQFSLCACISDMEYEYGQAAFDAYAVEIGDDPLDEQGYITYGSGYDWQAAFQEAFKDDPNIARVHFDSEGSGFFCDCDDLDILSDFGKRLRELSLDTEKFTTIVSAGIRKAAEQERLLTTVRGQLMEHPKATFDILTSYGDIRVTPDMTEKLLGGEMPTLRIGDTSYADWELLDQPVLGQQTDLFDENLIRMKAGEAPEPEEAPTMMM